MNDGSLQDITRKGGVPVESVRMRLRASAGPGKGFIIWFIDRIRVQRLARWPENGRIEIPEGFHYNPDWAPEKP